MIAIAAIGLLACNRYNGGNVPQPATSASANAAGDNAAPPTDVVLALDDDGKTVDIPRAGRVTFRLANNSGTGYIWTPTQLDPARLVAEGDRVSETASDTPGAPKADVYRFVAQGTGPTTVEMSLKRPFGTAAAARVVHFTLDVQ